MCIGWELNSVKSLGFRYAKIEGIFFKTHEEMDYLYFVEIYVKQVPVVGIRDKVVVRSGSFQ